MIDFTEVPYDSDKWELFCRDYLSARGFFIESTVDRGPDQGKDILVTEGLRGHLGNYKMRWLVSCKHFATSGRSVSEEHERNILERLGHFQAEGFIGFYSTVASSGLNARLSALRENGRIRDYSIMDGQLIENVLLTVGYSPLMMRYFPNSYRAVRPLHQIIAEYLPLPCIVCGKDLLMELFSNADCGIMVHVHGMPDEAGVSTYSKSYVVCRGQCDKIAEHRHRSEDTVTGWNELSDMVIPIEYLRYMLATMNLMRDGNARYTDMAFNEEKEILIALAQRVLRATTEQEQERFHMLRSLPF